jgi:hypothetical protein
MGPSKTKKGRRTRRLHTINSNAAGIDVGSQFHVVAVPEDRDAEPVRTFNSFTGDLHRLAAWLLGCRIDTVVMESTGVYWVALYQVLESRGIAVVVANARDVKHVPGRKSDVIDARWLQQLHAYGLLRGSFHPPADIAALRAYMRQRQRLLDYAGSHIQHMQKALVQMNIQLHHVVADITGKTGMGIVRAIVEGVHDPLLLAAHRDRRCKASEETIRAALQGPLCGRASLGLEPSRCPLRHLPEACRRVRSTH